MCGADTGACVLTPSVGHVITQADERTQARQEVIHESVEETSGDAGPELDDMNDAKGGNSCQRDWTVFLANICQAARKSTENVGPEFESMDDEGGSIHPNGRNSYLAGTISPPSDRTDAVCLLHPLATPMKSTNQKVQQQTEEEVQKVQEVQSQSREPREPADIEASSILGDIKDTLAKLVRFEAAAPSTEKSRPPSKKSRKRKVVVASAVTEDTTNLEKVKNYDKVVQERDNAIRQADEERSSSSDAVQKAKESYSRIIKEITYNNQGLANALKYRGVSSSMVNELAMGLIAVEKVKSVYDKIDNGDGEILDMVD